MLKAKPNQLGAGVLLVYTEMAKGSQVHFYWSGGISNIFYWTKIFLTSHDLRTGVFWVGCYTQVPNFLKK